MLAKTVPAKAKFDTQNRPEECSPRLQMRTLWRAFPLIFAKLQWATRAPIWTNPAFQKLSKNVTGRRPEQIFARKEMMPVPANPHR